MYSLTRVLRSSVRAAAGAADGIATALIIAGSAVYIAAGPLGWFLLGSAALTMVLAATIDRIRSSSSRTATMSLLVIGIAVNGAVLIWARLHLDGRAFAFAGPPVLTCLSVAYLIDVYRGEAALSRPLTSMLYVVQFPVLAAGPIVRYRDFSRFHRRSDRDVTLADVTYGVRRLVIGLVKVMFVAAVLADPVDVIFALPATKLTADAAWLAAVCFSLQIYFQFSGFADIAIGIGRFVGLRYPENFRRPYVADSVREFWRRWAVTSITWLRDYLSLPIAGRDAPSLALYANLLVGFTLIGLWLGAGSTLLIWAIYSATWLGVEAIGLDVWLDRTPAPLRHLYVLLVMIVGWVILRSDTAAHALLMVQTMIGMKGTWTLTAWRYLSPGLWFVLISAILGAGPLISWISRWRVSLDATTAAILMMIAATFVFLWRGVTLVFSAAAWRRRVEPPR